MTSSLIRLHEPCGGEGGADDSLLEFKLRFDATIDGRGFLELDSPLKGAQRSDACAQDRANGLISSASLLPSEPDRTRANAEPCHSCHEAVGLFEPCELVAEASGGPPAPRPWRRKRRVPSVCDATIPSVRPPSFARTRSLFACGLALFR
jgi:hypothetical protein